MAEKPAEYALQHVIDQFTAWHKVQGLSQSAAAKLIGCSAATLSQICSGTYAGVVSKYVENMKRALDRDDRAKRQPKKPAFVLTSVAEEVLATIQTAHDSGSIAAIIGPPGVGKTMALTCYATAEPDTIVLSIRPRGHTFRAQSVRPIFEKLAEALDIPMSNNTSNDILVERIAAALKASNRLLIVDEADYAMEPVLQCLRTIHDLAGTGIVFVGTPAFLQRLRRLNSATLNQFLSRIATCTTVRGVNDEDVEKILAGYQLDRTALAAAREGAHGCARRLVYALIGAQRLAELESRKLDAKAISAAFGQLLEA